MNLGNYLPKPKPLSLHFFHFLMFLICFSSLVLFFFLKKKIENLFFSFFGFSRFDIFSLIFLAC